MGPAGGYVIYDNEKSEEDGWRFIESSPGRLSYDYGEDWSRIYSFAGDNIAYDGFGFYRLSPNGNNLYVNGKTTQDSTCTSAEIGAGKSNTEKLVNNRKGNLYASETGDNLLEISIADAICQVECNGYNDWYLPSSKETVLILYECSKNFSSRSSIQIASSTEDSDVSAVGMVAQFSEYVPYIYYSIFHKSSGAEVFGVRYF